MCGVLVEEERRREYDGGTGLVVGETARVRCALNHQNIRKRDLQALARMPYLGIYDVLIPAKVLNGDDIAIP